MDEDFESYYALGLESDRLTEGTDSLEFTRTLELLEAVLPSPPADVLDVGGGPGVYASRLARSGYRVHLVDVFPDHVEQALALAAAPGASFTATTGDARDLHELQDASVDVVLLLGPLYHLTEPDDRVRTLAEARRLIRPKGAVVAAVISRFASLMDGIARGFLDDPDFVAIVQRDLEDGQHRNPEPIAKPEWFTTAFFHRPEDICEEVEAAGLQLERLVGVEGPGGWLARWPEQAGVIRRAAGLAEHIPALSPHMLAIARRGAR